MHDIPASGRAPAQPTEVSGTAEAHGVPAQPAGVPSPRTLGERYVLEEAVATGGMATVWRARDDLLARTVAVKILHDHLAADDAFRERFRREAISAAKLSHPNVVSVFDTGSDGGAVYLVMEYVDGPTLRDVVNDLGALDPGQAAAIGEQLARALAAAHGRGLVHRDVKPANILLCPDGTPKIADFGIAKADEGAQELTRPGVVLGTAAYVAPEQVRGASIDGQADQYGLGCVLYEALTGRRPFQAESAIATAAQRLDHDPTPMRSLRAGIPRGLDEVVMRAMAREPRARYPSLAHLADALAPFAESGPAPDLAGAPAGAAWTAAGARSRPRPTAVHPPSGPAAGGTAVLPPPATPYAGYTGDEEFAGKGGRWVGTVVAGLAMIVVLVGLGVAAGVLEIGGEGFPVRIAREGRGAAGPPLVAPVSIDGFDPQGDGSENDRDLPAILDGDNTTAWRTDLYRGSPRFGNLKNGVGFWVDLGASRTLHSVALRTTTPGISYEVRVADSPAPNVEGWRLGGGVAGAKALDEVRFAQPLTARYVLVWITGLQPRGGRYAAGFSAMAVRGTAP